jgi:cobalt/nickel transport system permease protein
MHIPDGFLDPWVAGVCWLLAGAAVGVAARRARTQLGDERTPLLGVVAAGVFAAQMLNWPIPGGVSAHFVGGAFAGILLGPSLGVLAMTAVVGIQALVFGDGGVVALGANLLAMAVVDVLVGHAVFRATRGLGETRAAFLGGWAAITVSALVVGLAVGLSSAFRFEVTTTLAILGAGHAILGVVEGAITAAVYGFIADQRPDLLGGRQPALSAEAGA